MLGFFCLKISYYLEIEFLIRQTYYLLYIFLKEKDY